MDRRTLIAGAVSLPLLPATGAAAQAATPNATDAAWAEHQAASAAYEAELARFHAFEDAIVEKIGWQPPRFMDDPEGWRARHDAYRQERAQYPENPYLEDNNPISERQSDAMMAMLEAPVRTIVDVERKLTVIHEISEGGSCIEAAWIESMLDGVRAMLGRAA